MLLGKLFAEPLEVEDVDVKVVDQSEKEKKHLDSLLKHFSDHLNRLGFKWPYRKMN